MKKFKTLNAVISIASRDVLKFLRDRTRIIMSMVMPILFVAVLGGMSQSGLGAVSGKDLLTFTFLGVLAQTLYQSTASGIISLINDRENDLSQELFVSPISRYVIIMGKIIGESTISFIQIFGVIVLGLLMGIKLSLFALALIFPTAAIVALLGGAFGVLVLGNFANERTANNIFPFIMFPQLFLAGVFTPIGATTGVMFVLTRMVPLTYAVDLIRGMYKIAFPNSTVDVLYSPLKNIIVIGIMTTVFLVLGTILFVKKEREK